MLLNIVLATLFAALRIHGETAPWFQAVAHLYVGFLLGTKKRDYIILAIVLSAIELVMFLLK